MTSGGLFAAADRVTPRRRPEPRPRERTTGVPRWRPADRRGGAGSGDLELAPPVRSELARALASLVFRCVPEGASA